MSMDAPRDSKKIIDDLGFRVGWLEKSLLMNIKKLEEIAARGLAPADALRKATADLAADTRKDLTELQVCAVERLLVQQRDGAAIIAFAPPASTSEKLPRLGLVPA